MRWLILTQYFPPEISAAPIRLSATIRELKRRGQDVQVVTALPNHPTGRIFPEFRGRFYRREVREGVPVHRVWLFASTGSGPGRILNYLSFLGTCLYGLARAGSADLVFVNSPPLFLSISGYLAARLRRVPLVFFVADLWPDSAREFAGFKYGSLIRIAEALEAWTYLVADKVICSTEEVRTVLLEKKRVPAEKVELLPSGADTEFFRPGAPDSALARELGVEGKKVILFAGNHGYAQGLEFVLQAARLLRDEKDIVFLFVGDGSSKAETIELARRLSLRNVIFKDAVPPEQVPRLHTIATAGLVPLRNVPLANRVRPIKTMVTMACGRAIIFCGGSEGERLVQAAGAGLVVPPEDPKALADAVLKLARDPALAERLGQSGRRYVEAELSWSVVMERWLQGFVRRLSRTSSMVGAILWLLPSAGWALPPSSANVSIPLAPGVTYSEFDCRAYAHDLRFRSLSLSAGSDARLGALRNRKAHPDSRCGAGYGGPDLLDLLSEGTLGKGILGAVNGTFFVGTDQGASGGPGYRSTTLLWTGMPGTSKGELLAPLRAKGAGLFFWGRQSGPRAVGFTPVACPGGKKTGPSCATGLPAPIDPSGPGGERKLSSTELIAAIRAAYPDVTLITQLTMPLDGGTLAPDGTLNHYTRCKESKQDWRCVRAQRTVLCAERDGTLSLLTTPRAYVYDLAVALREGSGCAKSCAAFFNLDGGGSTQLAYRDPTSHELLMHGTPRGGTAEHCATYRPVDNYLTLEETKWNN